MIFIPWLATLTLSLTAVVRAAGPGVVRVPVARGEAPSSALQDTLRKRASSKYASVDLQNLLSLYTINLTIAGQPTSVVVDTGNSRLYLHLPQELILADTSWQGPSNSGSTRTVTRRLV